jgi:hypothetical protein
MVTYMVDFAPTLVLLKRLVMLSFSLNSDAFL